MSLKSKLIPTGPESYTFGRYNVTNSSAYEIQICFLQDAVAGDTAWQTNNSLFRYLPYLTTQIAIMILVTRILMFILKPLRQRRFVSEVLVSSKYFETIYLLHSLNSLIIHRNFLFQAGIILGPTVLGKYYIANLIFPYETNLILETFASLGLTYYMFLVGLEMDVSALRNIGKRTLTIAIAGICIPLAAGAGLYFVPVRQIKNLQRESLPIGSAFWAVTLSITSFPDLARILSDVKLIHTDLGRTALITSLVSDITGWVLYVATITFYNVRRFYMAAVPTMIFLLICWFVLRPWIAWVIKQTKKKEDDKLGDTRIAFVLAGVAICGCITDACGSHSMLGGFMFGLIIPYGEFAIKIMESIGEFVNEIMLPGFLLLNGFRTNLRDIRSKTNWTRLAFVTVSATSTKIVSTVVAGMCFGMSLRDGLALGGLLNTKGVLALIILNEGRSLKV